MNKLKELMAERDRLNQEIKALQEKKIEVGPFRIERTDVGFYALTKACQMGPEKVAYRRFAYERTKEKMKETIEALISDLEKIKSELEVDE